MTTAAVAQPVANATDGTVLWHALHAALAAEAAQVPGAGRVLARVCGYCNDTPPPGWHHALHDSLTRLAQLVADSATVPTVRYLLGHATPSLAAFRQGAVRAFWLYTPPAPGHLLDLYRREVRWHCPAPPPRWLDLAHALHLLFVQLLPGSLAAVPVTRMLLLTDDERAALHELRRAMRDAPRAPAGVGTDPLQQIVASAGSVIQQVQQTIVLHPPPTPPDLLPLYQRYQAFVRESFGLLDFRGIVHLHNAVRLRLDQLMVSLTARRQHGAPVARRWLADDTVEHETLPVAELVRDTPLLVLLGAPGAGKSTVVRALLLALTGAPSGLHFELEGDWLPILFPVAAFAEARSAPGQSDLAPLTYLQQYYLGLSQPDYLPLFEHALHAGRALLLLDGLDEVRGDRLALLHCLEAFVREWETPGNRVVATSREAGYADAPLPDDLFVQATLQPLDDGAIGAFIVRWSHAYEQAGAPPAERDTTELQRRAIARATDLRDAVFSNANVTTLARSPLLLTILALIHQQGASLPERRVDLYRLCVEALAETWNRARSLSGREVDVYLGGEKLTERFIVNLLGPAALWVQEQHPGGVVERADLERQIADTLQRTDGLPAGRADRLAQSFIALVCHDTGLLQERGHGQFGFLHLTFEEYLAARAMLESVTVADLDGLLHERSTDPRWREVLRLLVAAASQREARRLLLHMLRAPTTPETHGRPVVLAGECLYDIGRNSATREAWEAVRAALVALLADASAPSATRLQAGAVLGLLDDPRLLNPATGNAATGDYWCALPDGWGWQAGNHPDIPLQSVMLATGGFIGRLPVTNHEYGQFVAAGGYTTPAWWTAHGQAFLRAVAADDPATQHQPGFWHERSLSAPNQPVVGLSWYEAAAYCRWLTAEGRRHGWLPPTAVIRLPTSHEWERAARTTDRRRYPWGDLPPTADHANYDATSLHAPAPVGCFPLGAAVCGALDLAGNVWEWTASLFDDLPAPHAVPDVAPTARPVIRGGAFNWSAAYLHCGASYWFSPRQRRNLLGFRLAWSTSAATGDDVPEGASA